MNRRLVPGVAAAVGIGVLLSVGALRGQTVVPVPDNKYTPAEDVALGRKAAVEVEKQLPILRDQAVTSLVESIGRRLVAVHPRKICAIPSSGIPSRSST